MNLIKIFTILFFVLFTLKTLFEYYLSYRQVQHVKAHMKSVPEDFKNSITLPEHQKAAHYTIAKSSFSKITMFIGLVAFIVWLPLGYLDKLDLWVRANFETDITRGLVMFGLFFAINLIIGIPQKIYSTFVLEEKFGFNKTTPSIFVTDFFKQLVLSAVIGIPFLYALLNIVEKLGSFWWLYAWIFMMSFQFLMILIYPTFIAPIFNKFSPLENSDLKTTIEKLLQKTGFAHSGLFVMDASKRSSHGNAYFTGFGKTKRIVFFDTILKSLSTNEVEAVLAHELGHFKHKHIVKMLVVSSISSLIGFFVLGFCYNSLEFFNAHFVTNQSSYMAILLFMLVSPLYTFFLTPLFSIMSRKHEYEADAFAANNSNAEDLITALVNLYKENANTLTPDPLYSKIYHSHPPATDRISHLRSLST